ncbi:glycogen debranching protein GlgX [Pseudoalteromonas sp. SCSIO 43201]|uniref:glycogen debranching protein GlgX n=1 Tax=Pseudoalteromonas TaxID=53246 RepID=UPI002075F839|nr:MULTISPECIES: glycogen debranching protein GlgX [Pseudoalteromonas]MDW7548567.1 glycogen debranching protein GlgX [Pseudoalteromonas peptidolytica]USD30690.1 glycogen debranching protein GlgX [Pseudoalteromonas sp. SCSIO 43201]
MLISYRGHPYTLGATVTGKGVNFCVYAPKAAKVTLCLFDKSGHSEVNRLPMFRHEGGNWSLFIEGAKAGDLYGYRVDGDYRAEKGLLFNVNKLLLDPYCKDFFGEFTWSERHFCHLPVGHLNPSDNACDMPKSKVVATEKYVGVRPNTPWSKTVIYECHVKGATVRHPEVPAKLQGKYLGLAEPVFIDHLKHIGVTAVQLLPVHAFINEQFLTTKGLKNYWGYNTLSFFTPHKSYLVSDDINEFKLMVERLHQAGIEVILDVVFNHTAEGGIDGPTISFKGFDNLTYYSTLPNKPNVYINDTGCGNTLNISNPVVLKLVLDSLRYWVEYMGVDGFRFDLATILARQTSGFSNQHAFLQALNQDPILSKVKLIAEPWDIGPGGYQLGQFPAPWREWNDKFRDTVRRFWRGDEGVLPELAMRIHGSSDVFEHNLRGPLNSINFITSHDGFSLFDWTAYEQKHNEANGEANRDGHSENYSFNCGVEGFSADPKVNELRLCMQKNALLTLFLSKGVPMICAGTEMAHSQNGNNNAYCQDNCTSWLAWKNHQQHHPLTFFIQDLLAIRKQFAAFSYLFYVHNSDSRFAVNWFNEEAKPLSPEQWREPSRKWLSYTITDQQLGQSLLIILNASDNTINIKLPQSAFSSNWKRAITTAVEVHKTDIDSYLQVPAKSAWIFTSIKGDE